MLVAGAGALMWSASSVQGLQVEHDATSATASIAATKTFIELAADSGHSGGARESKDKKAKPPVEPPAAPPEELTPAEQYCNSVQEAAAAAQIVLKKKELEEARGALEARIQQLDAKVAETKGWLKQRMDFLEKANGSLVEIYTKMSAEAAASRLVAMNEMVAAAILAKVPPRGASAILGEMNAAKAARLSSLLAGAAEVSATLKQPAEGSP